MAGRAGCGSGLLVDLAWSMCGLCLLELPSAHLQLKQEEPAGALRQRAPVVTGLGLMSSDFHIWRLEFSTDEFGFREWIGHLSDVSFHTLGLYHCLQGATWWPGPLSEPRIPRALDACV